jgi:hypothetical protein
LASVVDVSRSPNSLQEWPSHGEDTNSRWVQRIIALLQEEPDHREFVALRRKHPKETIAIAVTGGLDWLYGNEQTLAQFGISAELVADVLDANHDAISALSLQLLELIIER